MVFSCLDCEIEFPQEITYVVKGFSLLSSKDILCKIRFLIGYSYDSWFESFNGLIKYSVLRIPSSTVVTTWYEISTPFFEGLKTL